MFTTLCLFIGLFLSECFVSGTPSVVHQNGRISIHADVLPGSMSAHVDYELSWNHLTQPEIGIVHLRKTLSGYEGHFDIDVRDQDRGQLNYIITYLSRAGHVVQSYRDSIIITPPTPMSGSRLSRRGTTILSDDFSSHTLDMSKWWYEVTCHGGGSGQFQMYTPDSANTYIKNGVLYLKPTLTADKFGENFLHHGTLDVKKEWGSCTYDGNNGCLRHGSRHNIPPVMSSELHSKVKMSHGRVEVVAQLPKGDWIWPAIWLRSSWPQKYGDWPASGEIDIMEAKGNEILHDNHGNDKSIHVIKSTIHFGPNSSQHKQYGQPRTAPLGTTWADGFHKFTMDWNVDHIRIDVDDHPILAWTTPTQGYWKYGHFHGTDIWAHGGQDAPFDSKMSLVLNIAVGATNGYFPDNEVVPGGKPWHNTSPTAMMDFWTNRHMWQPSWKGDDIAMKIKSVRMIQY